MRRYTDHKKKKDRMRAEKQRRKESGRGAPKKTQEPTHKFGQFNIPARTRIESWKVPVADDLGDE